MPNSCVVCGKVNGKQAVSMHRFPAIESKRDEWLKGLGLSLNDIGQTSRVCNRHFLNGDTSTVPSRNIGKKFASPKKTHLQRGTRALKRTKLGSSFYAKAKRIPKCSTPCSSHDSSTNADSTHRSTTPAECDLSSVLSVSPGEQYFTDYSVHELPSMDDSEMSEIPESNVAIAARTEFLNRKQMEQENTSQSKMIHYFRLESIAGNDQLVKFYTGFDSYELLLKFFEFLGPSVNKLSYWGCERRKTSIRRLRKKKSFSN